MAEQEPKTEKNVEKKVEETTSPETKEVVTVDEKTQVRLDALRVKQYKVDTVNIPTIRINTGKWVMSTENDHVGNFYFIKRYKDENGDSKTKYIDLGKNIEGIVLAERQSYTDFDSETKKPIGFTNEFDPSNPNSPVAIKINGKLTKDENNNINVYSKNNIKNVLTINFPREQNAEKEKEYGHRTRFAWSVSLYIAANLPDYKEEQLEKDGSLKKVSQIVKIQFNYKSAGGWWDFCKGNVDILELTPTIIGVEKKSEESGVTFVTTFKNKIVNGKIVMLDDSKASEIFKFKDAVEETLETFLAQFLGMSLNAIKYSDENKAISTSSGAPSVPEAEDF